MPTACLLSEDNTIMPIAELRTHLWLASVWYSVSMHGKGNNFQWFLCIPTACLLSEDNTIKPIADAYFLSDAAQFQKYTLSDLVDHVDPKHTAAQQVVTIGAFCYPMVGHLREKDTWFACGPTWGCRELVVTSSGSLRITVANPLTQRYAQQGYATPVWLFSGACTVYLPSKARQD